MHHWLGEMTWNDMTWKWAWKWRWKFRFQWKLFETDNEHENEHDLNLKTNMKMKMDWRWIPTWKWTWITPAETPDSKKETWPALQSSSTLKWHPVAAPCSGTLQRRPAAAPCSGTSNQAPKHKQHSDRNTLQQHPAAALATKLVIFLERKMLVVRTYITLNHRRKFRS